MDLSFDLLPHTKSAVSTEQIVRAFHVRLSFPHSYWGNYLLLEFAANCLDPTFLCPYHWLKLFAVIAKNTYAIIILFNMLIIFEVWSSVQGLERRILEPGWRIHAVIVHLQSRSIKRWSCSHHDPRAAHIRTKLQYIADPKSNRALNLVSNPFRRLGHDWEISQPPSPPSGFGDGGEWREQLE